MTQRAWSQWLTFPRILGLSLVAAIVLAVPTLGMGFLYDDYIHLIRLQGGEAPGSRFDLFSFALGDPTEMRRWVERGPYPWWTLPELKLAFWRPLSTALAVMDDRLFGRNALAWHLHSLVWYLGVVAAMGAMLRRVLPGPVGALALGLFAIDGGHTLTVGWIANRNALVAALPALVGLWLHLEGREARRGGVRLLALAGLGLGLLGGESALGVFAYVLAYEAVGAPGGMKERLRALAPVALLGGVYLVGYKLAGYGAWGSGSYMDPVGEPGRFLGAALVRIPALVGGLVLEVPTDLWSLDTRLRPALVGLGVLALGVLGGSLRAAWPGLSPEERRHCRWLMLGAALSLVPVAATFPSNRLLLIPGLGGSVAVAAVLVGAWRSRARGWRPRGLALGAGVLGLAHLVLAPLLWPVMSNGMRAMGTQAEDATRTLEGELDFQRLPQQRVVVLALPVSTLGMYLPVMMAERGMPRPEAWWTLSLSPHPHVLTRTGPNALELTLTEGRFFTSEFESIFRDQEHALREGARVELPGLTARVLEADTQGPTRLGFTFDVPLEDPSLVLLHWRDGGPRRFTPPPEGQSVSL